MVDKRRGEDIVQCALCAGVAFAAVTCVFGAATPTRVLVLTLTLALTLARTHPSPSPSPAHHSFLTLLLDLPLPLDLTLPQVLPPPLELWGQMMCFVGVYGVGVYLLTPTSLFPHPRPHSPPTLPHTRAPTLSGACSLASACIGAWCSRR